ncbi:hypothetical protein E4Z66_11520 [Aliishimia ponticola]|uniref:Uncharacterized protein n=1 Tax=Aliishimia ponticola TaxID=2499833 RepID=A0A4S4NHY4_9RHOB|nr:hypothetical protein [Aliishimia ponticola]THH35710.1 hypothetical protein E4Z66_11520 [Aliishimia ponticola]
MSVATVSPVRSADANDSTEMNQDLLVALVAAALTEAWIAAAGLRHTVVPALPPSRRAFPELLARRLEKAQIFDDAFVDDLGTFLETLTAKINSTTHVGWEADENHVRGGYEVIYADCQTHALIQCANELHGVRDMVSAVLHGARAMRVSQEILDA